MSATGLPQSIESTLAGGAADLMRIHPVVSILVMVVIILVLFIAFLLKDAKDERKLNREALVGNTAILSELKELIRGALHR